MTAELHRQRWTVNHKRVLRIMRQEALFCHLKRSWIATTESHHTLQTYPNLLAGLAVERPNQAWVADSISGYRPPWSIWPVSWTPGRDAASAGSSREPSIRGCIRAWAICHRSSAKTFTTHWRGTHQNWSGELDAVQVCWDWQEWQSPSSGRILS